MQGMEFIYSKGGIIISCQLEVMDMFLNPMTKILSLPVTDGQGKMEFSFHNSWCWKRETLHEWWVARSNGQMDTELREHTWIKSPLPQPLPCHLLHSGEWMEPGETSALWVSGKHKPNFQQRLENLHLQIHSQTTSSLTNYKWYKSQRKDCSMFPY